MNKVYAKFLNSKAIMNDDLLMCKTVALAYSFNWMNKRLNISELMMHKVSRLNVRIVPTDQHFH
jgi:hypothetical protein